MPPVARTAAALAAAAVGLWLTWRVAGAWAWQRSGLDRDAAELDADCDQCGLTVVLDDVVVLVVCSLAYVVLVAVGVVLLRRGRRRGARRGHRAERDRVA